MTSRLWVAAAGAALLLGSALEAQEEAPAGTDGEATTVAVAAEEITGDADAGEGIFRRCQACHAVGEGAENKVGPVLNGVVGRPAAQWPDFEYSDAMVEAAAAGLVWTVVDLMEFLEKPRDKVPGTAMAFPGLRSEEDRADVIAYLYAHPAE